MIWRGRAQCDPGSRAWYVVRAACPDEVRGCCQGLPPVRPLKEAPFKAQASARERDSEELRFGPEGAYRVCLLARAGATGRLETPRQKAGLSLSISPWCFPLPGPLRLEMDVPF